MTREEWAVLTEEEQRIKVLEVWGWTDLCRTACEGQTMWALRGLPPGHTRPVFKTGAPDVLNDLNAMHEAEAMLTDEQHLRFSEELAYICDVWRNWSVCNAFAAINATAAQRAEAFVLTMEEK